jgi:hypothetical protein
MRAPFYLPPFALKNADIRPVSAPFLEALPAITINWLGPTPPTGCGSTARTEGSEASGGTCRLQPLDGPTRSAGQKADGNPQPDGAARHLIYSPPALFPLHHRLSPPTTFVRFVSAPSLAITGGQKQSEAALLPVRVDGVVSHQHFLPMNIFNGYSPPPRRYLS